MTGMTGVTGRAPRRHRSSGAGRAVVGAACVLGSLGLALAVPAATGPVPAGADPVADCSTTVGVVVAVDLSPWGGAVQRGCDATLSTALAALQANFTVDGTANYGDAFVCRIDGDPTVDQTPCTSTPPASASWSFWYAAAGSATWTYASQGAATFRPQAGSVEAWTFGAAGTNPASLPSPFTPAEVRATNSSPAAGNAPGATATTVPASSPSGGSSGPSGGGATPAAATGAGGPVASGPATAPTTNNTPGTGAGRSTTVGGAPSTAPSAPSAPSTAPGTGHAGTGTGTGPSGTGRSGAGTPRIIDAGPATLHRTPAGSPVPLVVGAVLVMAVGGVAGVLAWRRRRTT